MKTRDSKSQSKSDLEQIETARAALPDAEQAKWLINYDKANASEVELATLEYWARNNGAVVIDKAIEISDLMRQVRSYAIERDQVSTDHVTGK